jgi:GNAT superfamily N-acetyltransferase
MRDEQQIGICEMSLIPTRWRPQFAGWCECDLLLIADEWQGRGLGKYLLAEGLRQMRARGARHAMVNTDWDNYRAALFYSNFGYSFCDRTFAFGKDLREEHRDASG